MTEIRKRCQNFLNKLPKDEIKIKKFKQIKNLKPLIYPSVKIDSSKPNSIQSKRYVDMINRVMKKLSEMKTENKGDKDAPDGDDNEFDKILKDPSILINLMDPNFDVIMPNIDYFMENEFNDNMLLVKKKNPNEEHFKDMESIRQKYSKYSVPPHLRKVTSITDRDLKQVMMNNEMMNMKLIQENLINNVNMLKAEKQNSGKHEALLKLLLIFVYLLFKNELIDNLGKLIQTISKPDKPFCETISKQDRFKLEAEARIEVEHMMRKNGLKKYKDIGKYSRLFFNRKRQSFDKTDQRD